MGSDAGLLGSANLRRRSLLSAIPLFMLIALVIMLSLLSREFLRLVTLINLMQQVAPIGIVAVGAMLCIIIGGIDFTSGHGLAMIGMAASFFYVSGPFVGSLPMFILSFVVFGALLGLVNGFLIAKLNILPFIATLAMMSLVQGLSLYINGGTMILLVGSPVLGVGQGRIGGVVPVSFLIFLAVCVLAGIMLRHTKLGVYIYAIGGNETALWYTGVKVQHYKIMVYMLAGICTGIAALLTVSTIAMATPSMFGTTLIDAIAAACIGGTSMRGGKGTVFGTFIGAIIIVLINTAFIYLNIQSAMQDVFKGIVILFAVTVDAVANMKYNK
ncbi:MAG: ABC transporter permease [Oscillospiraceae bacterium]|nr:ABC transporter permease [Oscillospiraceae bacterium]